MSQAPDLSIHGMRLLILGWCILLRNNKNKNKQKKLPKIKHTKNGVERSAVNYLHYNISLYILLFWQKVSGSQHSKPLKKVFFVLIYLLELLLLFLLCLQPFSPPLNVTMVHIMLLRAWIALTINHPKKVLFQRVKFTTTWFHWWSH